MKLITLNTHSLEEPDYEEKLHRFVDVVLAEKPDIVAMQEVNQSAAAERVKPPELSGYVRCRDFEGEVRRDNHAARLSGLLREKGAEYFWTWVGAKLGYGKYDEGLAVFSRYPILEVDSFRISGCADYGNWKTRRILGIKTEAGWFYTVHMGWWDDEEEPFVKQWERLQKHIWAVTGEEEADSDKKLPETGDRCDLRMAGNAQRSETVDEEPGNMQRPESGNIQAGNVGQPVWLMGDFNSLDSIIGQVYDLLSESGWKDTFCLARERDCGVTVGKVIDGWRERLSDTKVLKNPKTEKEDSPDDGSACQEGMRMDYIWCSERVPILSSCVICNGENYPVVSDHYGVLVVTGNSSSVI